MSIRTAGLILFGCLLFASCERIVYLEDENADEGPAGLVVFDESLIHRVELFLSEADWQAIIEEAAAYENVNPKRPYYSAHMHFDGQVMDNDIGIRLKGHISIDLSEDHSFPLKIDFNRYADKQSFDGLKKLNLNNNFNGPVLPMVRDFISYHAWGEFGVTAPRTSFARVFVNGEDLGIYTLVEQVDGGFIKRHFPEPYGDLYKPEQISGTLEYKGPHISNYPDIGHKWPDESDHSSLLHALAVLDKGHAGDIGAVFNIESILIYLAGNVALGSFDYYPVTGHNYYLYEEHPGRFSMLPWDMNGSLELMGPEICSPLQGLLSRKLLEDPALEARYFELLNEFLLTVGSEDHLNSRLNDAQRILGEHIPAEEFEELRMEINTHHNNLKTEFESTPGCL
jgi:spore coat protein CotH